MKGSGINCNLGVGKLQQLHLAQHVSPFVSLIVQVLMIDLQDMKKYHQQFHGQNHKIGCC
jgi:hypothetical protein